LRGRLGGLAYVLNALLYGLACILSALLGALANILNALFCGLASVVLRLIKSMANRRNILTPEIRVGGRRRAYERQAISVATPTALNQRFFIDSSIN
jgi:hypothetical protein